MPSPVIVQAMGTVRLTVSVESVSAETFIEVRAMPLSRVMVSNSVISLVSCMVLMLIII